MGTVASFPVLCGFYPSLMQQDFPLQRTGSVDPDTHEPSVLATMLVVASGNTRTRWAIFKGREPDHARVEPNDTAVQAIVSSLKDAGQLPSLDCIAIASVHPAMTNELQGVLGELGKTVVVVGRDCMPPLEHSLDDATTLGIDRALNAFAAWSMIGCACVVIDAGTAITVDFIDGTGVFHGGAIAPGLRMMLKSLHNQTAGLPDLAFSKPEPIRGPFGKDTAHAMMLGCVASARGLVRELVERYAQAYKAYPRVIATGGDAHVLFDDDELIERIVPDLQLFGIQRTIEALLEDDELGAADDRTCDK